jgi:hypothetical protein
MEFPVDPAKVRVHIANYNQFEDQPTAGKPEAVCK